MRLPFLFAFVFFVSTLFGAGFCLAEVRIVKTKRSKEIPEARVRVVSPGDGDTIFSLSPEITLKVTNYELGVQTVSRKTELMENSGRGQHIHVIVNNLPYKAVYDVSKPVKLKGLGVGSHTLAVFPSRSYHESVKSPDAAHVINFKVLSPFSTGYPLEPDSPGVIYSRPKGLYEGAAAELIMVDFYLHNVVLEEDGYKVALSVFKGLDPLPDALVVREMFNEWRPAFVQGLESGEYIFRLQLIEPSGRQVPGKFGLVDRGIKVVR